MCVPDRFQWHVKLCVRTSDESSASKMVTKEVRTMQQNTPQFNAGITQRTLHRLFQYMKFHIRHQRRVAILTL